MAEMKTMRFVDGWRGGSVSSSARPGRARRGRSAMRVHQIERDVYHLTGESYESGSLVVLDGDRALLVDGLASVADAERLREIVAVEWGKRVSLLISTHYFSDHLAAWNLFPNAPVLAHE